MGVHINILVNRDKFHEKVKDARKWELLNLLHYLLFLDDTIEGYSWHLVESYYDTISGIVEINTLNELKRFLTHVFDYNAEDEIIEYIEGLNSNIAKDMFSFIMKDWKEKLLFFFIDRFLHEDVFIPFIMVRDDYREEIGKGYIALDDAIDEVVAMLNKKED